MNYFELLNLSPAFDLDLKALESAYFTAQRTYHPDRFVAKPVPEREAAMQKSVDINKAYETLKNPLKRAQYLLQLQGIRVGTEQDSVKPSQALLIEVMELREEPKEQSIIQSMIEQSTSLIAKHYASASYDAMAQEVLRLGYLQKVAHP